MDAESSKSPRTRSAFPQRNSPSSKLVAPNTSPQSARPLPVGPRRSSPREPFARRPNFSTGVRRAVLLSIDARLTSSAGPRPRSAQKPCRPPACSAPASVEAIWPSLPPSRTQAHQGRSRRSLSQRRLSRRNGCVHRAREVAADVSPLAALHLLQRSPPPPPRQMELPVPVEPHRSPAFGHVPQSQLCPSTQGAGGPQTGPQAKRPTTSVLLFIPGLLNSS